MRNEFNVKNFTVNLNKKRHEEEDRIENRENRYSTSIIQFKITDQLYYTPASGKNELTIYNDSCLLSSNLKSLEESEPKPKKNAERTHPFEHKTIVQ